MKSKEFEQLLYEEESSTLDFKRDQYPFAKASDEQKSELLKDILGFVNCWRRTEAFILIGVEEIQGGRSNVFGITEHLQDHTLQQFINGKTNRPIQFGYEAFEFKGEQVGIIRIELQQRPIYLNQDYGKLKKGEVYVRRGSSTDPTKPADPDEIARMGSEYVANVNEASLKVEFAEPDHEQSLGDHLEWSAEFCKFPNSEEIPTLDDQPNSIPLPGGRTFHILSSSSLASRDRLNSNFYHELAKYEFVRRLFKKMRLVVTNIGEVPATDVRLEICIPSGDGYGTIYESDIPDPPKRREDMLHFSSMKNLKLRPALRNAGYVDIDKNDHRTKVEIECRNLQPGRKVWTKSFFMGVDRSGEVKLTGQLFAANLSQPQDFSLSINATISKTAMSVDELMSLDKLSQEEE